MMRRRRGGRSFGRRRINPGYKVGRRRARSRRIKRYGSSRGGIRL